MGMKAITQAALKNGVKKLIYTSSGVTQLKGLAKRVNTLLQILGQILRAWMAMLKANIIQKKNYGTSTIKTKIRSMLLPCPLLLLSVLFLVMETSQAWV